MNPFQSWAMTYMLSYGRWEKENTRDDFLRRLLYNHQPKRFMEVYARPLASVLPAAEDEGIPIDPSEFGDIDEYLAKIDRKRIATARQQGPEDGWV